MTSKHDKDTQRVRTARKLRNLTKEFVFNSGQMALCGDSEITVSVDYINAPGHEAAHLVSVLDGVPPTEGVQRLPWTLRDAATGRIQRTGPTDERGCFWLKDLETGTYRLQFEGLVKPISVKISDTFAAWHGDVGEKEQDFHDNTNDQSKGARLRLTESGDWMLEVTVEPGNWDDSRPIVCFCITKINGELIREGFMGLYDDRGYGCGQLNLDLLDRDGRKNWADCALKIDVMPLDALGEDADEPERLKACLSITDHPVARAALERALAMVQEKLK